MRPLYFVIKFIPFWAIPAALIATEVAFIYKRRGRKDVVWKAGVVAGSFTLLTVVFFIYRWDVNAVPLLHEFLQSTLPEVLEATPTQ